MITVRPADERLRTNIGWLDSRQLGDMMHWRTAMRQGTLRTSDQGALEGTQPPQLFAPLVRSGGRTWAHHKFTPINNKLTILPKKIEERLILCGFLRFLTPRSL